MTVSELRTLVDNLDEYVHIPDGINRLKKMVLHLAVSGQLVPQDPSEGTGEELYRQIQAEKAELVQQGKLKKQKPLPKIESDNLLPGIPVTWTQVKIGDASIYQQRGKSPKYAATSSYPVVSQKCVRWNHIDWQHVKFITPESVEKYEEFRLLRDGDLLLNSTGTGTMGRVGIYRKNKQYDRVVADSHVTVVRFGDFVSAEFAHIFFRSPYVQEDVESKASGSTNQIEWNLSSIQNEIIPLPPLVEQKRIVAKVNSIFTVIDQLAEVYKSEQTERGKLVASSLAQLVRGECVAKDRLALTHLPEIIRTKADAKILRQTILHLAVSGQLVPQDPSEGTGEELYRQIQAEKAKYKKQRSLYGLNEIEKPFEIPNNWKWVRLPEIYTNLTPVTKVKTSDILESGKLPVIDQGQRFIAGYVNEGVMNKIDKPVVVFGDHTREIKLIDFDFIVGADGVKILEPVLIDSKFFHILVDVLRPQSRGYSRHFKLLNEKSAPLPPLAEQKRIVAKTAQLFDLVSELEEHLIG